MVYHRWGLLLLLLRLLLRLMLDLSSFLGLCVARVRARAISAIDVIDVSTVGIDIAVGARAFSSFAAP